MNKERRRGEPSPIFEVKHQASGRQPTGQRGCKPSKRNLAQGYRSLVQKGYLREAINLPLTVAISFFLARNSFDLTMPRLICYALFGLWRYTLPSVNPNQKSAYSLTIRLRVRNCLDRERKTYHVLFHSLMQRNNFLEIIDLFKQLRTTGQKVMLNFIKLTSQIRGFFS